MAFPTNYSYQQPHPVDLRYAHPTGPYAEQAYAESSFHQRQATGADVHMPRLSPVPHYADADRYASGAEHSEMGAPVANLGPAIHNQRLHHGRRDPA
jgi:hypothetical protein